MGFSLKPKARFASPTGSRFQGMAFSLMSSVATEVALWSGTWPTVVLFPGSELSTPWWRKPVHLTPSEICMAEPHGMPSWREVSKRPS